MKRWFLVILVIISSIANAQTGGTKMAKTWTEPKVANVEAAKKYTALIKTSKGDIVCELFAKDAPLSVTNFKYLADGGFYNGLTFHRVV
ncbi:MAG: peptidylprolyl isomerase, partial [Deltaproteobacteria bacterium]|nr:peptidylprolyl isomerase [Deltaproteobacteria bacterium]